MPFDVDSQIEIIIKQRASLFVKDNFVCPTASDFLVIETAMMIGASIALESQIEVAEERTCLNLFTNDGGSTC